MLTLSFVIRAKDCIDCKLYWNSQMSAFKPSDIKNILPKLFNMKWNGEDKLKDGEKSINEKFLAGERTNFSEQDQYDIDKLIEMMKERVKDIHFDNFYKNLIS